MSEAVEEKIAKVIWASRLLIQPREPWGAHLPVRSVTEKFCLEAARDVLAVIPQYRIAEPKSGFRAHGSFTPEEKAKLRPMAETLAMLDGNAFFGNEAHDGQEWYEMYLPEAAALYDANGGDGGWAGEASFAKGARS